MATRTVIYGLNSVLAALRAADGRVVRIWLDAAREDVRAREVLELAGRDGLKVQRCGRVALEKFSGTPHHQGVALEWLAPALGTEQDLRGLVQSEGGRPFATGARRRAGSAQPGCLPAISRRSRRLCGCGSPHRAVGSRRRCAM